MRLWNCSWSAVSQKTARSSSVYCDCVLIWSQNIHGQMLWLKFTQEKPLHEFGGAHSTVPQQMTFMLPQTIHISLGPAPNV